MLICTQLTPETCNTYDFFGLRVKDSHTTFPEGTEALSEYVSNICHNVVYIFLFFTYEVPLNSNTEQVRVYSGTAGADPFA